MYGNTSTAFFLPESPRTLSEQSQPVHSGWFLINGCRAGPRGHLSLHFSINRLKHLGGITPDGMTQFDEFKRIDSALADLRLMNKRVRLLNFFSNFTLCHASFKTPFTKQLTKLAIRRTMNCSCTHYRHKV